MQRVVSRQTRGPGNRLKSYLSARMLDPEARVVWPVNEFCGARWHDLFENDVEVADVCPSDYEIGTWRLVPPTGAEPVDFMYQQTPETVISAYQPLVEELRPVRAIRDRIAQGRKLINDKTLVLSVRSWWEVSQRNISEDEIANMAEFVGNRRVFLTCDHPRALRAVSAAVTGPLVYLPRRTTWGDRHSVAGVQDAVADMYLGGMAPELFATFGSTFCEMQWWLGGCSAVVTEWGREEREVRKPRNWEKYFNRVRGWRDAQ